MAPWRNTWTSHSFDILWYFEPWNKQQTRISRCLKTTQKDSCAKSLKLCVWKFAALSKSLLEVSRLLLPSSCTPSKSFLQSPAPPKKHKTSESPSLFCPCASSIESKMDRNIIFQFKIKTVNSCFSSSREAWVHAVQIRLSCRFSDVWKVYVTRSLKNEVQQNSERFWRSSYSMISMSLSLFRWTQSCSIVHPVCFGFRFLGCDLSRERALEFLEFWWFPCRKQSANAEKPRLRSQAVANRSILKLLTQKLTIEIGSNESYIKGLDDKSKGPCHANRAPKFHVITEFARGGRDLKHVNNFLSQAVRWTCLNHCWLTIDEITKQITWSTSTKKTHSFSTYLNMVPTCSKRQDCLWFLRCLLRRTSCLAMTSNVDEVNSNNLWRFLNSEAKLYIPSWVARSIAVVNAARSRLPSNLARLKDFGSLIHPDLKTTS